MVSAMDTTAKYFVTECSGKQAKVKETTTGIVLDLGAGRQISGVTSIAKYLQRESAEYRALSLEERMAVEQWLEYAQTEILHDRESEKLVLQELNSYLQDKVYFVANCLTLADILLYHSLHSIFTKLTFQDKEKYIHVSRWFNNVQQERKARQALPGIVFLRTPIYDGVSVH